MLLLAASRLVAAVTDFTIGLRALVLTTDQGAEQVDLPRKVLEVYRAIVNSIRAGSRLIMT